MVDQNKTQQGQAPLPNTQDAQRQAGVGTSTNPTHDEIDRWFQESFVNTRLGNDTETWNLVHAAKEDLKRRLG
jgi:hypothetical protein